MENPEPYQIERLQPGLFALDDGRGDSFYLIEGEQKALLVDTGMAREPLAPLLRSLTEKPVELALTHAHLDHMYHADEFGAVRLHRGDLAAWGGTLRPFNRLLGLVSHLPARRYRARTFAPIAQGDTIDLGGTVIRVLDAAGHTPGSCLFVDESHRAVFTGDAVGSGAGVWLWLPGCLPVSTYRASLASLLTQLAPYRDFTFYGGHRGQAGPASGIPDSHPLTAAVVEDMITLCGRMLDGAPPVRRHKVFGQRVFEYTCGMAGMWERKRKIR
jgi:glyoxylase-like metal-dependent hydrolase (beta-lactamase superfamily II)